MPAHPLARPEAARPSFPRLLGSLFGLALIGAALVTPSVSASSGPGWVRVQFDRRILETDRSALEAAGLDAAQYVPRHAYLAFGGGGATTRAESISGVSSVLPLRPEQKVDPTLPDAGLVAAEVLVHPSSADRLAGRLAEGSLLAGRFPSHGLETVVFRGPAAALPSVAADPGVQHVGPAALGFFAEDEGTDQILAGNVSGGRPVPGYEPFLAQRGIDGEGVIVTIADTGMDEGHPELQGRIVKEFFAEEGDPGGHGTHVAGIVGGKGAVLPTFGRAEDNQDLLLGLGVAPKVSFIDEAILGGAAPDFPPNEFESLTRLSSREGSIGWNASWNTGGAAGAGYVPRARALDFVVRDADAETPGNQPFAMMFSAGNSGPNPRTITQPKEAKNIITVGSTHSHRVIPASSTGIDTVSSFSSRGPGRDGRILPNVAAPGQDVASAMAFGFVCGSAGDAITFTMGFGRYVNCSGTSMAAPHATGAVVLIHDWWRERNGGADPSPAMAKALLVNSATDMGAADVPNGNEGWGRINLGTLFDPGTERVLVDQNVVFTARDQLHALEIVPADPSKPLRVTAAWTDAPGMAGARPALVNDLDLRVTAPNGDVFLGNAFAGGTSGTGGTADRLNNVENVFLSQPSAGTYRVEVAAWNVPGDGIPGDPQLTDQDFALVISNARLAPTL
jgi:hypothetical protein